MAKVSIRAGTTSYTASVFIQDSGSTTGAGKTGLLYSGLTAYYVRPGAAAAVLTLATQTPAGAWSSGGFVEIDSANMPGFYRLDIPDAVIAAAAKSAAILIKGTGMAPLPLEIELTATDNQDAAAGGMSRLDAAVSSRSTYAGGAVASVTGPVTVGSNNDKTGYALSSAGVQGIWDALTAALTSAGSIGKRISDFLTGDAYVRIGSGGAELNAIGDARMANLDATVSSRSTYTGGPVASVTAPVSLAAGEYTSIADAVLKRDWSAVSGEAGRSCLNAFRFLRNKWSIAGGTLTVTKEDDTTTAWTAAVTTEASADPVVGSDPA